MFHISYLFHVTNSRLAHFPLLFHRSASTSCSHRNTLHLRVFLLPSSPSDVTSCTSRVRIASKTTSRAYRSSSRTSQWITVYSPCCLLASWKCAQRLTATSSTPAGCAPSSFLPVPVLSTTVSHAATQSTKIVSKSLLQTQMHRSCSANVSDNSAFPQLLRKLSGSALSLHLPQHQLPKRSKLNVRRHASAGSSVALPRRADPPRPLLTLARSRSISGTAWCRSMIQAESGILLLVKSARLGM
jgi:hypothetical protein